MTRSKKKRVLEAASAAADAIGEGLRVKGFAAEAMGAEQVARELRGSLTMVDVARAALLALTPNEIAELLEGAPVIAAAQALRDAVKKKRGLGRTMDVLIAELEAAKL